VRVRGCFVIFAKQVGGMVVAEGVETRDELLALRALGADAAQGYYLGHPADRIDVTDGAGLPQPLVDR
jgi:EAL domain-containing protein (putative c-di-GMP-specific phosphodiesterase class I)